MKSRFLSLLNYILVLFFGIAIGAYTIYKFPRWSRTLESIANPPNVGYYNWGEDFKLVEIKSSVDDDIQKAFFYNTTSAASKPLVVSLHTWSGNYGENDPLAKLCKSKNLNYIHPDFRGANTTKEACNSPLVMGDIDDAISYALEHSNVDSTKIYVIGASGGGYTALGAFMKSKHRIAKFSAWASITDLIAWYKEALIRKNGFPKDILSCTDSQNGVLNKVSAKERSPIFWKTPLDKFSAAALTIYVGVYDGIQGSVPITHSINFYNKLLSDLSVTDPEKFVSDSEKLQLLEYRKPLGNFGLLSNRKICLIKEFESIKLVIFEGGHEILSEFALNELLRF